MSLEDESPKTPSGGRPGAEFAPTRWTLVLRSRGDSSEARAALSELCATYYQPVLAFLRRDGHELAASQDLAHEFFARVLSGSGFAAANEERGRFRSYLLGALKHFLSDQRASARRVKRGGGVAPLPLDQLADEDKEGERHIPDPRATSPAEAFDRQWALIVLSRGLAAVAHDMKAKGKEKQFAILKPWLVGDTPGLSQAQAATELGMTETAVKVTVHRLRQRVAQAIRREIAQTLTNPVQAEEELAHLVRALT